MFYLNTTMFIRLFVCHNDTYSVTHTATVWPTISVTYSDCMSNRPEIFIVSPSKEKLC